jgi:hypothetical protein
MSAETQLLVIVIPEDNLEELLLILAGVGVTDGVQIKTRQLAKDLFGRIPVFAGLRNLVEGERRDSHTVFVPADEMAIEAILKGIDKQEAEREEPLVRMVFQVPMVVLRKSGDL